MGADPHGNCFGGTSDHELCSADKPTGPEAPLSIRQFDTHSTVAKTRSLSPIIYVYEPLWQGPAHSCVSRLSSVRHTFVPSRPLAQWLGTYIEIQVW